MNWDYIAGFFDGEGSINIVKLENTFRIAVTIKQCDEKILQDIRDFIGYGSVQPCKVYNGKARPYVLSLQSKQSYDFLCQLVGNLRLKGREAELAIELCDYKKAVRPKSGPGTSFSARHLIAMQQMKDELEACRA